MNSPYEPISCYLAAPFEERPTMLALKAELEARGVRVTSTWLTPDDSLSMNQLAAKDNRFHECRVRAIKDFEDIRAGDFFVVYKPKGLHRTPTTGGHHVETGYAAALGKPIIVFGDRENVFHYLPGVQVAPSPAVLFTLMGV